MKKKRITKLTLAACSGNANINFSSVLLRLGIAALQKYGYGESGKRSKNLMNLKLVHDPLQCRTRRILEQ
ncbi:unnamed protein product [Gongylonema pulchrum]|uniref:ANK_REP_REGION domain-containing protein n=1 Tax=Gongylonema pulchrum TaxID=637853 RepID=A0A183DG36_9BILA|nr:unnamed protein product [Gongylonema pulchrum]